ncbi:MAG: hypothetical protein AAGA48_21955 [Myxococcota bacterium]
MRMWTGWVVVSLVACNGEEGNEPTAGMGEAQTFAFENTGNDNREGHTPRGFQGQGGGIFTGDNLNDGFPEGDGVQIFISFNLARGADGESLVDDGATTVESALLAAAVEPQIEGSPFADLGDLLADEVIHDGFSSALWDLEPPANGGSCVFATGPNQPFECDFADAVQNALDDGRRFLDVRMRFETAGDNDSSQDMVFFFTQNVNATEPGLFTLDVTAR